MTGFSVPMALREKVRLKSTWHCTYCGERMPLPDLWVHLRKRHSYDRDAFNDGGWMTKRRRVLKERDT